MGSDRIRRTTSRSRAKAATTPVRVVRDREGRDPHLQMMISAGAIQALLHMADRAVELGMWHAGPSFAPALARTEDQARRLVHRGKDGGLSAVWHCNCGARKAVGSLPERAGTYTATCRRGRAEQSRAEQRGVECSGRYARSIQADGPVGGGVVLGLGPRQRLAHGTATVSRRNVKVLQNRRPPASCHLSCFSLLLTPARADSERIVSSILAISSPTPTFIPLLTSRSRRCCSLRPCTTYA